AARREALRVALQLLQALLDDAQLVGRVVDREGRLVAEPRRLLAQDAAAGGVGGEDPDRPRDAAQQGLDAVAQPGRRTVRDRGRGWFLAPRDSGPETARASLEGALVRC